jgi:PAS domain S-box-containing protein
VGTSTVQRRRDPAPSITDESHVAGDGRRSVEVEVERRKDSDAFRLFVTAVKDYAIFALDATGHVATWNKGAEQLKGYTAADILGKHFSTFYPAEDVQRGKCEYELERATIDGRFEDEDWRVRKDGTRFWANVVITAVRDDDGRLMGFSKVTRDLTERRRAEEERIQLAQSVESNRVRDEFLATISHELRSPLNAILGWATLLASQTSDPYVTKAADTIARNARAQARLIDDLLDVSRIISGKLRLEVGPADLITIARDALESTRPSAEAKGIQLQLEHEDAPALLVGDAARLQQVVTNLLSNAVKFTPRGGSVVVRVEPQGTQVHLSVRDTGRGIEPAFLPHVFERFRQADSSSSRRTGGLGLGLAIVRHLVELHGGRAEVQSPGVGQGSTFLVRLPVRAVVRRYDPDDDERESRASLPAVRLDGISVLVVDDDGDSREVFAAALQARGASVTTVPSADAARAALEHSLPHVVVSDIGMPVEDGYAFARSIRDLGIAGVDKLPMLAVTAYTSAHHARRALDAGFQEQVFKPVVADQLAAIVHRLAKR